MNSFEEALLQGRIERIERCVDEVLQILKRQPVAPLVSRPTTPQDCGCPRNGYVCNNAYCPRAPRVTS